MYKTVPTLKLKHGVKYIPSAYIIKLNKNQARILVVIYGITQLALTPNINRNK